MVGTLAAAKRHKPVRDGEQLAWFGSDNYLERDTRISCLNHDKDKFSP